MLVVLSIVYVVLWAAGAIASLVFRLTLLTSRPWLIAISLVLLVVSLAVVAREMGLLSGSNRPKAK